MFDAPETPLSPSYLDIVERRRALRILGYATLGDVGFDGDWVTPYQIASRSPDGPVLVAYNWLDAPSVGEHQETLRTLGYLPHIHFNKVLDLALTERRLERKDIYVTQVFHLLPSRRSGTIPARDLDRSFDEVTRYELIGRRVIALGEAAAQACDRHGVKAVSAPHPSSRGTTFEARAKRVAAAFMEAGF